MAPRCGQLLKEDFALLKTFECCLSYLTLFALFSYQTLFGQESTFVNLNKFFKSKVVDVDVEI